MRYLPYDDEEHEDYEISAMDPYSEQFPDEPIYKCKNCSNKNTGYEEKQSSPLTIIAAVVFLLVFQFYSLFILPLVIEATKTITKKCLKCDHILEKQELLSTPSLTDKVLNFKCGSCAVVISRKYALIIIAILTVIWFFIPSQKHSGNAGGVALENLTWTDFVEDCGKKVVLNNQFRAQRNFDQKYARNIIEWEGIVQDVLTRERIRDNAVTFVVHIKMNPTEAQEEFPDVQLTFTNSMEKKYSETLKVLTPGDIVGFRAVMISMGDELHHNNFEALSIKFMGEKMDLKMIPRIDYTGAVNNMRGKGDSTEGQGTVSSDNSIAKEENNEKEAVKEEKTSSGNDVQKEGQDDQGIDSQDVQSGSSSVDGNKVEEEKKS